jgi:hypothetical protein
MKTCSLAVEPAEEEEVAIPLARFITCQEGEGGRERRGRGEKENLMSEIKPRSIEKKDPFVVIREIRT